MSAAPRSAVAIVVLAVAVGAGTAGGAHGAMAASVPDARPAANGPPMVAGDAAADDDAERGLELVASERLTPRLEALTFESPALGGRTRARVLTPEGFDRDRDRLPVLWLLHGCCDDYRSWTDKGAAEAITDGLPLIVVMPDGGQAGFYTDWYGDGPAWATYHLDELRPWVEHHYRTRTDRAGRSIAGLSMGGFGAMSYAARHPDLFAVAAAFSGAVDNMNLAVGTVFDVAAALDGGGPGDIWGPRLTAEANWRAHNPVDLAPNLETVRVHLRAGNGLPGGRHGGGPDVLEIATYTTMVSLHQRLARLHIPHVWADYGPGAHQWPYWKDGLRATLPAVMTAAEARAEPPTRVTHLAYEPAFSVWGWDVSLRRSNLEITRLSVAPDGFRLRGSGRGSVTTPPRYPAGTVVRASRAGQPEAQLLTADERGRVTVPVDLGPPNRADQHGVEALATGSAVRSDAVELEVVAPAARSEAGTGGLPRLGAPPGPRTALPATGDGPAPVVPVAAAALAVAALTARRSAAGSVVGR